MRLFRKRHKNIDLERKNQIRVIPPKDKVKQEARISLKSPFQTTRAITQSLQPSRWARHKKTFWGLLAFSLLVVGYIFVFYSAYFTVSNIVIVRKDLTLNRSAIETELLQLYGQNIFTLDVLSVQKRLARKFPALAYANIRRVYPRTLEVEVNSFPDKVILRDPLGQDYIVNEVGMISRVGVEEYKLPLVVFTDNVRLAEYKEKEQAKAEKLGGETLSEELAKDDAEEDKALITDENETEAPAVEPTTETTPPLTPEEEVAPETEPSKTDEKAKAEDTATPKKATFQKAQEDVVSEEAPHLYEMGEIVLAHDTLTKLLEIESSFESKFGMNVDSVEYYPVEREVHLLVVAVYPFIVKLDLQQTLEEQFQKLKYMAEKVDLANEPLEYIDLRIAGNKIFYKKLK